MTPKNTSEQLKNPNELLAIPNWINQEYFQPILEQKVANFAHIKKCTPIAATAPGENYTSIMVRVLLDIELKDGSEEQYSYILKTKLDGDDEDAALVEGICLFPKEKQMYELLIPRFTKLYKDAGVSIQLAPECIFVEETADHMAIVLEDLKCRNFKNVNRLNGFDMPHMRCVLRKLAELHAASALSYELYGAFDQLYYITFFSESNRAIFEGLLKARQQLHFKAMRTWGLENVEQYIESTPEPSVLFDGALLLAKVDDAEFNVLNHGDCWSNNIMFNYKDNGDIDETLFVDLQVGKWGSPVQDLWYLITTSAALDIKVKEFDHFIQIYHTHLVECLKLLKYEKPIPTLKQLHIMMLTDGLWGPLTASGVLLVILFPSDTEANMANMLKLGPEGDAFRYKLFTNPYYAKAMCQLLPFFKNKGVLLTK